MYVSNNREACDMSRNSEQMIVDKQRLRMIHKGFSLASLRRGLSGEFGVSRLQVQPRSI